MAQVLEDGFRSGCMGALVAAQQVLPDMLAKGKGTILLTGATASLRGGALFASLAAPKSALRTLAQRYGLADGAVQYRSRSLNLFIRHSPLWHS